MNKTLTKLLFSSLFVLALASCGSKPVEQPSSQPEEVKTSEVVEPSGPYIPEKESYKVACVGDSLTAGHYWSSQAYPVYLKNYFDENGISGINFDVKNCGVNGISITGYGGSWDDPAKKYVLQDVYTQTVTYQPDIICILLGTNDATGWENAKDIFEDGYKSLLESFRTDIPDASIIMMTPPPTTGTNQFNIPGDTIVDIVDPIIRNIAEEEEVELIDTEKVFSAYNPLSDLIRDDKVHLSVKGAELMAETVANGIFDLM